MLEPADSCSPTAGLGPAALAEARAPRRPSGSKSPRATPAFDGRSFGDARRL